MYHSLALWRMHFIVHVRKAEIIKGGREVCGDRGLFITKKRYAINIYDAENKRTDANGAMKVKAMGLDLKRADTPKYVQDFLNGSIRNDSIWNRS